MQVEEVRWALKHWTRLETLLGLSLDQEARRLLEGRVNWWA